MREKQSRDILYHRTHMKTSKTKMLKAERDSFVIGAITRARNAMMLLQGTRVTFGRKSGFIDFEKEILKLTSALQVMGVDTPTPTFDQPIPKHLVPRERSSRARRTVSN